MIKAIETHYNGYRFRSRLEARWAVFFDAAEVRYEYEFQGFDLGDVGCYLPDFYLPDLPLWVEVKPVQPSAEELDKAKALCHATMDEVVMVVGSPWFTVIWDGFVYDEDFREVRHWSGDAPDEEAVDRWLQDQLYFQCMTTFGIKYPSGKFDLVCLVDSGDDGAALSLRYAYEAARSARFEHGETPNP